MPPSPPPRAKLKEAELNLSYSTITAPISGVTGRAERRGQPRHRGHGFGAAHAPDAGEPHLVRFSLAEQDFNASRRRAQCHGAARGHDN
jgi:multidrug efflux pump subunit AcrA (membrane-fusion protein)